MNRARAIEVLVGLFIAPAWGLSGEEPADPRDEIEIYLNAFYERPLERRQHYDRLSAAAKISLKAVARGRTRHTGTRRKCAIDSLAYEPSRENERILIDVIMGESVENIAIWHAAIFSLQQICSEAGRAALLEILDASPEADWRRELFALQTLAHCGTLEDVPVVERCAADPNPDLAAMAAHARAMLQQRFPPPENPQP